MQLINKTHNRGLRSNLNVTNIEHFDEDNLLRPQFLYNKS